MAPYSPNVKAYWAQWGSLEMENDLLKRVLESDDGQQRRLQLLIPRGKVREVLRQLHEGTGGGHFRRRWRNCAKDVIG